MKTIKVGKIITCVLCLWLCGGCATGWNPDVQAARNAARFAAKEQNGVPWYVHTDQQGRVN